MNKAVDTITKRTKEFMQLINHNVTLSLMAQPLIVTKNNYYVDWPAWIELNYIDEVIPIFSRYDIESYMSTFNYNFELLKNRTSVLSKIKAIGIQN